MSTACVSEHDSVPLMDGQHPLIAYSAFSAIDQHSGIKHPSKPNLWHPYYSQITDFQWQTPSVPATHLLFRYQPRGSVICCPVGRKYAFEPTSSEGENNSLLKNQHFQIQIRSGTHKLLSDPWVNKLQITHWFPSSSFEDFALLLALVSGSPNSFSSPYLFTDRAFLHELIYFFSRYDRPYWSKP